MPVAVAAQGTTAGGGLGILLTGDYAVIGENSRIGSLYANIGLTPDLSVSAQLAKAVGERRALQLVLRDRMLSAQEALDWGLVAEVVGARRGALTGGGGRPVLARRRGPGLRPGEAPRARLVRRARSPTSWPKRRARSAPRSTPPTPRRASRPSPRHPPRSRTGETHDRQAPRRQDHPDVRRQPRHRPRDRPARGGRRRERRADGEDRHPAPEARGHGALGGGADPRRRWQRAADRRRRAQRRRHHRGRAEDAGRVRRHRHRDQQRERHRPLPLARPRRRRSTT